MVAMLCDQIISNDDALISRSVIFVCVNNYMELMFFLSQYSDVYFIDE